MVVNIMLDEKFTAGYIEFFENNFDCKDFKYVILTKHKNLRYCEDLKNNKNVEVIYLSIAGILKLTRYILVAKAIILHGMFIKQLTYMIWILCAASKSYWIVFGGDLYSDEDGIYKFIKKKVVKKLRGLIVGLKGDYTVAQNKYNTNSKRFYCIGPNAMIKKEDYIDFSDIHNENIKIMLGNSADDENRHYFLIDSIKKHINSNTEVYIPLSYGDKAYAENVKNYAKVELGKCARPMMDFMKLEEYVSLLKKIDIVVYAHERQQAFSNTVQLISNGSKLYMSHNSTIYQWLKECGIEVYDINNIDNNFLSILSVEKKKNNADIIRKECSLEEISKRWREVFKDINELN